MALRKKILTLLLITISIFQLSFFGLAPREVKIIGDILLILLLVYLFIFYRNGSEIQNAETANISKKPKRIVFLFVSYVIFQIFYSYFLWGDFFLVLRQSRRWLIAALYFYLIVSGYQILFESRVIIRYLIAAAVLIVINIFLLNNGFIFPSADSVWQFQGSTIVFKPFIPGSIILYFLLIQAAIVFLTNNIQFKRRLLFFIFVLTMFIICIEMVPFRGWVISSFLAVIFSSIVFYLSKKKFLKLIKWGLIVSCFGVLILLTGFASSKIQWLSSSFIEVTELEGDFLARYLNDISKLEIVEDKNSYLNGIGFIHQDSDAAAFLGFSSETNDTGWVEIFLTGGIFGSAIFIILYISVLRFFLKLFFTSKDSNILILVSIWIMGGLLMFSSNLLLWDFGFVPISLISIAILSKSYKENENDNVGR